MRRANARPFTVLTHLAPGFPEPLFAELAAVIGQYLDAPVRLEVDPSKSGPRCNDAEPFSSGDVDVAFMCATSYVWLRARNPSPVALAGAGWVPLDPRSQGRPVFFTDIVVRAHDRYERFDDLRGVTIACNDDASLSGYHSLRLELLRRGLDPDEYWNLRVTGGHHRSIAALLEGDVDAAAIDSVVLWRARREQPNAAKLRSVLRCGPFPVQPAVVRADMPDGKRRAVREALLGAHRAMPVALQEAGLFRFAPVDDTHYDELARALTQADARY